MIDWLPLYDESIISFEITIDNYPGNCHIGFRFHRCHLRELCLAFGMTGVIKLESRSAITTQYAFLFLLNHISSLKTLIELEKIWGRDYTALSRIYCYLIERHFDQFSFLLIRNMAWFVPRFQCRTRKFLLASLPLFLLVSNVLPYLEMLLISKYQSLVVQVIFRPPAR